ncbi:prostaglandin E receptor 2b subtype EP2 [Ictalurus furcatus]|uniref:prostaglandin E receptor 2b subtype EP2 n=1 Tax=Ictalurus furcatus TaxID=66913 RepID=UPI002350BFA0|nr:prostaglandin E receptor 2b subtype EP2 [Ictalurus furcatus]
MNISEHCEGEQWVREGSPTTSALMFSAGVLGNAVALVLLEVRRRRRKQSARGNSSSCNLFQVLLTSLLVTDLLGTCSVSPLVIAAYARNESLSALGGSQVACQYFGFAMTFFSLVTLALLLCMALERCLSIAVPYFYERRLSVRCGYLALALVYLSGALFCLAPFFGFGEYVQYCPGTWCFVDMSAQQEHNVYKNLYASCLLVMIACIVLCNVCVIYHLVLMYRRCELHRGSARRFRTSAPTRSLSEELEHLVLLAFMTITFLICSLPLVICLYISSPRTNRSLDLTALLLLSMNPILDPWVFILLSPPVPRLLWEALCKVLRPRPLDNKVPLSVSPQTAIELQT